MQRKLEIPQFLRSRDQPDMERFTESLLQYLTSVTDVINNATQGLGDNIASAATITPSYFSHLVTGTATITTINAIEGFVGPLLLYSDAGFSLGTGGNISRAVSTVAGDSVLLFYNEREDVWYPVESIVTEADLATDAKAPILANIRTYGNSGSPHTWTKPANLAFVVTRVIGSGAGGGGVSGGGSGQAQSGGGGGGGFAEKVILAGALGATETVTVAAGGAGGANTGGQGTNGGTTSFGAHCSATGGVGGVGGAQTTGNTERNGGAGGTGTGGDVNIQGGRGGMGIVRTGVWVSMPFGGGTAITPLTGFSTAAVNAAGIAGQSPGGGGTGCVTSSSGQVGGDGADGLAVVYEYVRQ